MPKVHLLEDGLINKIAAGEVVERPFSVVKELVENSIDAGATKIQIELEDGGKKLISVVDNGSGMAPEDAELALKRHCTSKISGIDDLFNVATMGFRGEALASISAVSHFTLSTRLEGDEQGTRIVFRDGRQEIDPWSGPSGTQISISDLFANVPARRAFLKTGAAEFALCHEFIQALALCRPDLCISLKHNGKSYLDVSGIKTKSEDFWGENAIRRRAEIVLPDTEGMVYICQTDKFGSMEALCSSPGRERGSNKFMFTFVNGRWVKDKAIRYSVLRGYHSHLLKGKFPVCAINLRIEPSLVDVNVHPAKAEVRFQYSQEIQSFIAHSIKERLRMGDWATPFMSPREPVQGPNVSSPQTTLRQSFSQQRPSKGEQDFDLAFNGQEKTSVYRPEKLKSKISSFDQSHPLKSARKVDPNPSRPGAVLAHDEESQNPFEVDLSEEIAQSGKNSIPWRDMRFIGAFGKCYLLFEWNDKMYALDQHAFHERILYERLLQNEKILSEKQTLLMPEVIHLGAEITTKLMDTHELYSQYGFAYRKISEDEIEVISVPSLLKDVHLESLFASLANQPPGDDPRLTLNHQTLATMACHAAVRSGEELPEAELNHLLGEADSVDFYENCPHGRRVIRVWSRDEVGRWFDR